MKKKILILMAVFTIIFVSSGLYTIMRIRASTLMMDDLLKIHQVSILREHLLLQIKRTQTDFYLRNTRYARSIDTLVSHVRNLDKVVDTCFACHHSEDVTQRLASLHKKVEMYKNALSRVYTIRSNERRLKEEEDATFKIGSELNDEVSTIILMTNLKREQQTEIVLRNIRKSTYMIYAIVVVVPLMIIVTSLFFLRAFTKPVTELISATRKLKQGDLNYRISGLQDEFGEVADSFNAMASSLKEDYLRMQWAEQLIVLGEMAGGLAHEIKNPLAGIKTSMEVLSRDKTISDENRSILVKGVEQSRKIEGLLKNLLNFAQPPKPQLARTSIAAVIDSTVALAFQHPSFDIREGKEISIVKDHGADLPEIMADPLQLQQVFMNLLLNSADAMPEKGTITIRTSRDSSSLRISVTDTGKGVDAQVIDKIFQPFFTTKAHGTGLGLAISKRLIIQHGGTITVKNQDRVGVEFVIVLPLNNTNEVTSS